VHALGPFALCGLVLPGMRSRRRGSIVMISSQSTAVAPSHGAPSRWRKRPWKLSPEPWPMRTRRSGSG
jgi:NAD(P)-dependent dehydrogenase (short-subunit alcohol dehydrogenase family)